MGYLIIFWLKVRPKINLSNKLNIQSFIKHLNAIQESINLYQDLHKTH